ncbi:hypothetical protein [Pseudoxanthomonas sp.]|uniref:hypothetical protein n=1 Tax=Pseudoxanthomonas sp. TaxID=1871049 RepID=UPI002625867C|nr:hypothetical protein [Pseudoxanthomonas sp.]WDS36589.1 MAG: hypothetical protein O8I58_01300 [Pseudoxanthomonas sp.]
MGPIKRHDETLSAYRFRYARYCLKWAGGLLLLPVTLVAFAPLAGELPAFAWFFIGFVMLFGVGGALLAAFGFAIGGWAGSVSNRFPAVDGVSRWIGALLGCLLIAALAAFSWHALIQAVQTHQIWTLQRHDSHLVQFAQSPVAFSTSIAFHCVIALGIPGWLLRELLTGRLARRIDARASKRSID